MSNKMRRQREDIQVNVAGLRRNIKNLAHNYSDAQVKVREATSNDPWGPSSTLMSEIADLTYNVVAFTEIMQMIWKRLNDHGKNWRHVYKALMLLDYLIKTASDKVSLQCKENIYVIKTLRDFQYVEDGKDQGFNVREKAKTLVQLLGDDERLRNERARCMKAKERFAQASSGFGSEGAPSSDAGSPSSPTLMSNSVYRDQYRGAERCTSAELSNRVEMECARPQTAGEEELQLQLAIAMSKEEAEQEEQKKRSDDVRLQLALSQSENEFNPDIAQSSSGKHHNNMSSRQHNGNSGPSMSSNVLDLLGVETCNTIGAVVGPTSSNVDPWGMPTTCAPSIPPIPSAVSTSNISRPQPDPWSCPASIPPADPWAPATNGLPSVPVAKPDPWAPVAGASPTPASNDPWSLPPQMSSPEDEFAEITNRNKSPVNGAVSIDPFDVSTITDDMKSTTLTNPSSTPLQPIKKTPQSFLGENSALVNLDNLITVPPAVPALPVIHPQKTGPLANPFSSTSSGGSAFSSANTGGSSVFQQSTPPNFFEQPQQRSVSINQMRQQQPFQTTLPQPLVPQPNPFLS